MTHDCMILIWKKTSYSWYLWKYLNMEWTDIMKFLLIFLAEIMWLFLGDARWNNKQASQYLQHFLVA